MKLSTGLIIGSLWLCTAFTHFAQAQAQAEISGIIVPWDGPITGIKSVRQNQLEQATSRNHRDPQSTG